jgi:SAM-dependent MidA family methyltransferase
MLKPCVAQSAADCKQLNALAQLLRDEIRRDGPVSFARFMEAALYHAEFGYYERDLRQVGKRGDFYTSTSVGPLFGELLAFQFAEWLGKCGMRSAECGMSSALPALRIVEAGAHDGRLATDVLNHFQTFRPGVFVNLEYTIVEPSLDRRAWQETTLSGYNDKVRWVSDVSELGATPHSALRTPRFTIFFSNELLDAFPVHRLGWDAKEAGWFEWGVNFDGDGFVWTRMPGQLAIKARRPLAAFGVPSGDLPPELLAVLPDGFTIEVCPAAVNWWRQAAKALEWGVLLTLDYGLRAEEFFAPQRSAGTLRAYREHRVSDDLLTDPGEQDLTAHVNFTALQQAGEGIGLATEGLVSQEEFLTKIFSATNQASAQFPQWTPERTRQFQTLTHPEHLGRPFKVLLQAAGPGK